MGTKRKLVDGWKIKGAWQWCIAMMSFVVFLLLQAAILYAYYVFLASH